MNEIMVKLNELLVMVEAKNKDVDATLVKQATTTKEQSATAATQAEKSADLNGREEKVAKVESILEIEQINKDTIKKIAQEKGDFAEAKSAHNQQVAKDKADIAVREKGIVDDFKTLKEGQVKLAEGEKKLAEDRKEMKKQVIEEIAKSVK